MDYKYGSIIISSEVKDPIVDGVVSNGDILPGMICSIVGYDYEAGLLRIAPSAPNVPRVSDIVSSVRSGALVAVEDRMSGKGIDDPFSVGDKISVYQTMQGDVVFGLVYADDTALYPGQSLVAGDDVFDYATMIPGYLVNNSGAIYLTMARALHRNIIPVGWQGRIPIQIGQP